MNSVEHVASLGSEEVEAHSWPTPCMRWAHGLRRPRCFNGRVTVSDHGVRCTGAESRRLQPDT